MISLPVTQNWKWRYGAFSSILMTTVVGLAYLHLHPLVSPLVIQQAPGSPSQPWLYVVIRKPNSLALSLDNTKEKLKFQNSPAKQAAAYIWGKFVWDHTSTHFLPFPILLPPLPCHLPWEYFFENSLAYQFSSQCLLLRNQPKTNNSYQNSLYHSGWDRFHHENNPQNFSGLKQSKFISCSCYLTI